MISDSDVFLQLRFWASVLSISFYLFGGFLMAQMFFLAEIFLFFPSFTITASVSDSYRKYPGKMSRSFTSINTIRFVKKRYYYCDL